MSGNLFHREDVGTIALNHAAGCYLLWRAEVTTVVSFARRGRGNKGQHLSAEGGEIERWAAAFGTKAPFSAASTVSRRA